MFVARRYNPVPLAGCCVPAQRPSVDGTWTAACAPGRRRQTRTDRSSRDRVCVYYPSADAIQVTMIGSAATMAKYWAELSMHSPACRESDAHWRSNQSNDRYFTSRPISKPESASCESPRCDALVHRFGAFQRCISHPQPRREHGRTSSVRSSRSPVQFHPESPISFATRSRSRSRTRSWSRFTNDLS
jgi:hypothetical protein